MSTHYPENDNFDREYDHDRNDPRNESERGPKVDAERLLPDQYGRDRLALGFDYHEETVEAIKDCPWSLIHQDWQPGYRFGSGREGAWVVNGTVDALNVLDDELPIEIPPIEAVEWRVGANLKHLPNGPVELECPTCGAPGMISEEGAPVVYNSDSVWLAPLRETERATHACSSCHTLYYWPGPAEPADGDEEISIVDADELINATPEQRGRYLAREHDLRDPVALAVAYREAGYTASGIAKKIDSTEGTVNGYLRQIADEYGLEATETKSVSRRQGPLGGDR